MSSQAVSPDASPAPFQRRTWDLALADCSGLIHTPTGSGKTLAALGAPVTAAAQEQVVLCVEGGLLTTPRQRG